MALNLWTLFLGDSPGSAQGGLMALVQPDPAETGEFGRILARLIVPESKKGGDAAAIFPVLPLNILTSGAITGGVAQKNQAENDGGIPPGSGTAEKSPGESFAKTLCVNGDAAGNAPAETGIAGSNAPKPPFFENAGMEEPPAVTAAEEGAGGLAIIQGRIFTSADKAVGTALPDDISVQGRVPTENARKAAGTPEMGSERPERILSSGPNPGKHHPDSPAVPPAAVRMPEEAAGPGEKICPAVQAPADWMGGGPVADGTPTSQNVAGPAPGRAAGPEAGTAALGEGSGKGATALPAAEIAGKPAVASGAEWGALLGNTVREDSPAAGNVTVTPVLTGGGKVPAEIQIAKAAGKDRPAAEVEWGERASLFKEKAASARPAGGGNGPKKNFVSGKGTEKAVFVPVEAEGEEGFVLAGNGQKSTSGNTVRPPRFGRNGGAGWNDLLNRPGAPEPGEPRPRPQALLEIFTGHGQKNAPEKAGIPRALKGEAAEGPPKSPVNGNSSGRTVRRELREELPLRGFAGEHRTVEAEKNKTAAPASPAAGGRNPGPDAELFRSTGPQNPSRESKQPPADGQIFSARTPQVGHSHSGGAPAASAGQNGGNHRGGSKGKKPVERSREAPGRRSDAAGAASRDIGAKKPAPAVTVPETGKPKHPLLASEMLQEKFPAEPAARTGGSRSGAASVKASVPPPGGTAETASPVSQEGAKNVELAAVPGQKNLPEHLLSQRHEIRSHPAAVQAPALGRAAGGRHGTAHFGGTGTPGQMLPLPQENFVRIAEQIVRNIRLYLSSREHRITVRLKPDHLGAVEIVVSRSKEETRATLYVERPEVRHALETGLSQLQRHIAEQNIRIDRIEVQDFAAQLFHRDAGPESRGNLSSRREWSRNPDGLTPVAPAEDAAGAGRAKIRDFGYNTVELIV